MMDPLLTPPKHPEYYRRVRVITCELISVWRMFAEIEKFLWSDSPNDRIAKKLPFIYKSYLQIDDERLKQIVFYYNNSLQGLKEIDVVLYYNLEHRLFSLYRVVEEILRPLLQEREYHYFEQNNFLKDLLRDVIKELENAIRQTTSHLPADEQPPINQIIEDHIHRLKNPPKEEIPQFILGVVNNNLPDGKYVVEQDFAPFFEQNTIFFFIGKVIDWGILDLLGSDKPHLLFSLFADFSNKDFRQLDMLAESNQFKERAKHFRFTQEEIETHFYNNKPFYKFFLGFLKTMKGDIPFEVKRKVIELNNGKIDPNKVLREIFPNPDEVVEEAPFAEVVDETPKTDTKKTKRTKAEVE